MKLDKDLFLVNMNMVELNGKKVLIQPSQAKSIKGKEVDIGEERRTRMISQKVRRIANGRRMREASHSNAQRPPLTSSWLGIRKAGPASGGIKTGPSRIPNRTD
jgi:hypothetical protein